MAAPEYPAEIRAAIIEATGNIAAALIAKTPGDLNEAFEVLNKIVERSLRTVLDKYRNLMP